MSGLWFAAQRRGGGQIVLRSNIGLFVHEEKKDLSQREQIIQLFRELRVPLYTYLIAIGIRHHEADDIVQEAFLRFHQQVQLGAKINAPRTWLFRVIQNVALSRHRSERRLVFDALEGGESNGLAQEKADSRPNPEELYIQREQLRRLDASLAQLTEQQRFCLHLRAEGLKYREIGVVLGISTSSVGELIQRAISRLAGEVDE